MAFEISDNSTQVSIKISGYHMDMTGHNYVGKYIQIFIFNAVIQAVYDHITVARACENVDPSYHCKSEEVGGIGICFS